MESEQFGSFQQCYQAYRACRRYKRKSPGVLQFERKLLDELTTLSERLQTRRWRPSRSVCFIVTRPKAREIHAARFADRVVHHLLVPELEKLYELVFIHDSYSNRKGKGAHAAVVRLQGFMRAGLAPHSELTPPSPTLPPQGGQGARGRFFLQLDIRNFFNCIDREILYGLLKKHLAKMERKGRISTAQHEWLRWLCHRLLAQHPAKNVLYVGREKREVVPPYKRLENAPAQCGLPIGNLTSQFFANVYLNELDQFIKRELRCRHYVRYVDDSVLLHHDREQLLMWKQQIECFLTEKLHLQLKADYRLASVNNGVDFLGYVVRPHYRLVRRRVVEHLHEKLRAYTRQLGDSQHLNLRRIDVDALQAMLTSYLGHCRHANSYRLLVSLWQQYPWLRQLFALNPATASITSRLEPPIVTSLASQISWFRQQYPGHRLVMQVGWRWEEPLTPQPPLPQGARGSKRHVFLPPAPLAGEGLGKGGNGAAVMCENHIRVAERGYLNNGLKRRVVVEIHG